MFHAYLPLSVVSLILFVGTTISKTLYVSIFDNFTINCPLKSEGIKVDWNGPPSMTPYGSNGNVNGRIKGIDIIGDIDNLESSLVIYGFHESNEGAYQCATVNDGKPVKKDFTVILQNKMETENVRCYFCEEECDYGYVIIGHTANIHHENFLSVKYKCLKKYK